jgi:hypothetical protein
MLIFSLRSCNKTDASKIAAPNSKNVASTVTRSLSFSPKKKKQPADKYSRLKRVRKQYRFHFSHPDCSYVIWQSKNNPNLTKLAVFKPALDHKPRLLKRRQYIKEIVIREAFASQIFVAMLGKHRAAKGKIRYEDFGYISRVLSADSQTLQKYILDDKGAKPISATALDSLLRTACMSLLLGDRDISAKNLIAVKVNGNVDFIYSIDHEYCFVYCDGDNDKRVEFISKIFAKPELFIYMLFRDFGWSDPVIDPYTAMILQSKDQSAIARAIRQSDWPQMYTRVNHLIFEAEYVSGQRICAILSELIENIKQNDFSVLAQVRDKLISDIPENYPAEEKERFILLLDAFSRNFKYIVTNMEQVIAPYMQQPDQPMQSAQTVHLSSSNPLRRASTALTMS